MFVDTEPLRRRSSALAENIGVYMNTLGFSRIVKRGMCARACADISFFIPTVDVKVFHFFSI